MIETDVKTEGELLVPISSSTAPPNLPKNEKKLTKSERQKEQSQDSLSSEVVVGDRTTSMCAMVIGATVSTLAYACIAPFFPSVARRQGANSVHIGGIFAVYQLTQLICSPLLGRYMQRIGTRPLFIGGLLVSGVSQIALSCLLSVPLGWPFILLAFLARIFSAFGTAAFVTTNLALATTMFPEKSSTIIGLLELCYGLGYIIGPPIGGVLYETIGYAGPFVILGSLPLILAFIFMFILTETEHKSSSDAIKPLTSGVFGLLKIPAVLLVLLCAVASMLSFGFFESSLQQHLVEFKLNPITLGVVFLVPSITYTTGSLSVGYIVDRTPFSGNICLIILGSIGSAIALLLLGPSSLLNISKLLPPIIIALGILGVSVAALFIPTFSIISTLAVQRGYPKDIGTSGSISGLLNSAMCLGGTLGPLLGGIGIESIGFSTTATIIATGHLILALCLTCIFIVKYFSSKSNSGFKLHSEEDSKDVQNPNMSCCETTVSL